jgi:hypothetical protein
VSPAADRGGYANKQIAEIISTVRPSRRTDQFNAEARPARPGELIKYAIEEDY